MMKLIDKFADRLGDNILTLSGEIIISSASPIDKGAIAQLDRTPISRILLKVNQGFPYISVENHSGLVEVNIKFFANGVRTGNSEFLENFQTVMADLAATILEDDRFAVRVNMFGKFETLHSIKEFRYINKRSDVRYTVTDEIFKGTSALFNRPIYYLIVGLVACGLYFGYVGYKKIVAPKDGVKVEQKVQGNKKESKALEHDAKGFKIDGSVKKQVDNGKPVGAKEI